MTGSAPNIDAVAKRVCELAAKATDRRASEILPSMEWDRDVFESLDELDFILDCEAEFGVDLSTKELARFNRDRDRTKPLVLLQFAEFIVDNWHNAVTRCSKCRYDLTGLPNGLCPECGLQHRRARW